MQIGALPVGARHDAGAPATSRRALTERTVTAVGLGVSATFVAGAVLAAASSLISGGSPWAGLHLALVGGAVVAIGTFMPHFAVTLAGTVPAPGPTRLLGVALLAFGGALAVAGMTLAPPALTVAGGASIAAGLALTAWLSFRPLREPLARRHSIVAVAYGVALVQLAAGIGLAVGLVAGWEPIARAWMQLKPAHVWLNLLGAVSLVIAATLVYLYPTVLGARIKPSPSLAALVGGFVTGPPLAALGAALAWDRLALIGAAVALAGAIGQLAYVVEIARRRGTFAADLGWRRVAAGHLSVGVVWFAAALGVALVGIARDGVAPPGWTIGALAIPLVGGWVLQVLVGSWTHLLPGVTAGSPDRHRRQRALLAIGGRPRLVAWNAGVGLAWAGAGLGIAPLAVTGGLLLGSAVAASVVLLAWALLVREG